MSETTTTPQIVWSIQPSRVNYESVAKALVLRFDHAGCRPKDMSAPIASILDLLRGELLRLPPVVEYRARLAAAREKRVVITGGNWDATAYHEAQKFAECARHPAMAAILAAAREYSEETAKKDPTAGLLRELAERCQDVLLRIAAAAQVQSAKTMLGGSIAEDCASAMLDVLAPR